MSIKHFRQALSFSRNTCQLFFCRSVHSANPELRLHPFHFGHALIRRIRRLLRPFYAPAEAPVVDALKDARPLFLHRQLRVRSLLLRVLQFFVATHDFLRGLFACGVLLLLPARGRFRRLL